MPRTGTGLLLAVALAPAAARAQSPRCDYWITSLPYTPPGTQQGTHCLSRDIIWGGSGAAISIEPFGTRITLDLNGHRLLAFGTAGTIGIRCSLCSGATITNGGVEGFETGIAVSGIAGAARPDDAVIEDVVVRGSWRYGIKVTGHGVMVRNNRIEGTGVPAVSGWVYGIWVSGPQNRVLDNDVATMWIATGMAQAIYIYATNAAGSIIEGNRVTDRRADEPGQAITVGGTAPDGNDVLVVDNRISGVRTGVYFYAGLTGKYRGNVTSGVRDPFLGGTDAGNNN